MELTLEQKGLLADEDTQGYINLNTQGGKPMGTLKEEAQAFEPKQTLNIADLQEVEIESLEVEPREGTDENGKTFEYKVVIKDKKEYRVPNSVLEEIQKILKLKPEVKKVKVKKSGSGLATRYKVDAI